MALGASEVGRVSVRVMPDVEDFRTEAKADLEREVAGLEIEIPITLDTTGLRQKIQAAVAAASRGIEATVGVDIDNANLALARAFAGNRPEIDVAARIDEDDLRRMTEQISRALERGTSRSGNNFLRGRNLLTRSIFTAVTDIQDLGRETAKLAGIFRRNWRAMRNSVDEVTDALERNAGRIRAVGEAGRELRDTMRDTARAAEAVRTSTATLGDDLDAASRAYAGFLRRAQAVREADSDVVIRPRIDESALQRFRRELGEAIDRIRRPVDAGRVVDTAEGERELSVFEAAVLRVARRVREISAAIRDTIRNSSLLRYVWNGLSTVVRGIPGWVARFAREVVNVRGNWERLQVLFLRTAITIDDLGRRAAVFGRTTYNRAWIELGAAIDRVRSGVDRFFVGVNRVFISIDDGFRRVRSTVDAVGDGITRLSARVYDFRANTLDMAGRWHDIRRATILATEGASRFGRALIDIRSYPDRIRSGISAISTAIRNIDYNRIGRGLISLGDSGVRGARRIGNAFSGIGDIFKSLGTLGVAAFNGIGDAFRAGFQGIQGGVSAALSNIKGLFEGTGQSAKNIALLIAQIVSSIGLIVGILGAVSAAITIIGAAIAGVISTVSVLIASLPGALLLIAGPVAAIAVGLDGIKAAAASIKPEFEALQASVSATFERGLTPIFRSLANDVFPSLKTGLNSIATELVGVAQKMLDVVRSEAGLKNLNATFQNISNAVRDLGPVFADLIAVILEMGAVEEVFSALTGFLREFVSEWRNSIAELQSGPDVLASAFTGLEALLGAVARAFTYLIENGIRAFATAAPGMTAGLDSLTNFFDRFDWDRLGTAIGDVFQGMGEALDKVDASTIEAITQAFERLGDTFRNADYQNMFTNVVEAIPAALTAMDTLIAGFARVASFLSGMIQQFVGFGQIISGSFQLIQVAAQAAGDIPGTLSGKYTAAFAAANAEIQRGVQNFGNGFQSMGDAVVTGWGRVTQNISQYGAKAGAEVQKAYAAILKEQEAGGALIGERGALGVSQALGRMPAAVSQGLAPLPGAVREGFAPAAPAATEGIGNLAPVVESSFSGLSAPASAGLTQVNSQIIAGVAVWGLSVATGFQRVATAAQTGFQAVSTAASAGLIGINSQIIAAVSVWALSVQLGFQGIANGATAGFASLSAAVSAGLIGINSQIMAGVSVWALSVQLGFANIATGATVGFAALSAAVSAGLIGVNSQIIAGVGVWALSVQLGMQRLGTAATTGFAGVSAAVGAGMTQVNSRIIAGVGVWALSIQLGVQRLATAATAGFAIVGTAVSAQLTAINSRIIAGVSVWALSFTLGFQRIAASVTSAFAVISAAVSAGLTQINSRIIAGSSVWTSTVNIAVQQMTVAVTTGFARMAAAATSGMTAMAAAVRAGTQQAVSAINAGVSSMVAALNAAVGRFRAAGSNMGAALAAGLNSQVGAVQAAAARLANAAAAATRAAAQIASPSRVFTRLGEFTGQGYEKGILNSISGVVAAIRRVVGAARDAASDTGMGMTFTPEVEAPNVGRLGTLGATIAEVVESDDFGSVGDKVAEAIAGWTVDIDGNGIAKMVNKSNTRKARR